MDSALAWIGWVAEWLGKFIPRREILDMTEGAIKYKGGNKPIFCGPGIHWWWPWRSTWTHYPMKRQPVRLDTQTLESSDGKTFMASGVLIFEVADLLALITTTFSADRTVEEMAGTALHDALCKLTWPKLQEGQQKGTLKTALKNAAQKELDGFGVNVIQFKLNTLARCRVYKVSQSTSSEEN